MDRKAKLNKLKTDKIPLIADGKPFIDALDTKLKEFKELFGDGIDLKTEKLFDKLNEIEFLKGDLSKLQESLDKLVIPDYPDKVTIDGLEEFSRTLKEHGNVKIDFSTLTPITELVGSLIDKVEQIAAPKQGQEPSDYIPMRRVMMVGKRLMYDDSFYTGGGGGSQGDFVDQTNKTTSVKLTAEGNVPVDIQDASITVAGITNDGTFATPARQDTGNTSLSSIDGKLTTLNAKDFATQTTLALIKAKTDNLDVALSTRTKPADAQHVIVDSGVTTGLTDTQLRATPVPISGTVTATTGGLTDTQLRATPVPISGSLTNISGTVSLPTGAATGTKQDTGNASLSSIDTKLSGTLTTYENSATSLVAFITAVTTAGTRVQLASNATKAGILQAPSTNSGIIYVGGSTVSSTVYGAELQPGQASGIEISNTNKIYIDASVSGDKCAFLGSV